VTAPDFLGQLHEFTSGPAPAINALYRWQPATRDYATIALGESLAAGTVLWVSAQTNAVVSVRGEYVEPSQWGAPGGQTFVAVPALEAQPLTVPAGVTVWRYDAHNAGWQSALAGDLASLSDLPPTLAPGEAFYVHSIESADLGVPAPEERIRYYHQDHLGSSSVMTDTIGTLVEETAFYPFGTPRNEYRLRQIDEHYKFTQKERDRESGLHYFESRFLSSVFPRFIRVDALASDLPSEWLMVPQKLNPYSYVANNPLRFIDPMGMDNEKAPASAPKSALIMYSEDQFKEFQSKARSADRPAFHEALKATYKAETGDKAAVLVQMVGSKHDLRKLVTGKSFDVITYKGHGSLNTRELLPGGDVGISPKDIHDALAGAKSKPQKMFLYGCDTAKTGFAEELSSLLPDTAITGTGAVIRSRYETEQRGNKTVHLIKENRSHNVTFKNGGEIHDVRKRDAKNQEAVIPRGEFR
jgi:RHS repeat-associated protein